MLEDNVRKALISYVTEEITQYQIDLQGLPLEKVVEETVELILDNIDGDLCRNTIETIGYLKEKDDENA